MNFNTKLIKSLFIVIFTCLFAIPDSALCAKEIINWYVNDFPPGYILKEPFKEQGFNDIQQKLIIRQMKNYEHITKISSLSRALADMKAGENVCFVCGIYQLNNEYLISSIPFYHLPVHSIIISEDSRRLFPSDDKISLKNLLQNKELVFGMPSGRNYGEYIDPIINEFRGQANIYIRTGAGSDDNEGLVKMLLAGRIDYIIDYSFISLYILRKLNLPEDKISAVQLQELENSPPVICAVWCPKTPWGEKVIRDINKSIKKMRYSDEHRQVLQKWVIPKGGEKRYWDIFKKLGNH